MVDRKEHGFESRNIDKIALNGQSTAQVFFVVAQARDWFARLVSAARLAAERASDALRAIEAERAAAAEVVAWMVVIMGMFVCVSHGTHLSFCRSYLFGHDIS